MEYIYLGKIVNNYAIFLDKSVEVMSNTQQDISDAAGRLQEDKYEL